MSSSDQQQMLFSLHDGAQEAPVPVRLVGGKGAGLIQLCRGGLQEHIPRGFALSVAFFHGWTTQVLASGAWKACLEAQKSSDDPEGEEEACRQVKAFVRDLSLSQEQAQVVRTLQQSIRTWPSQVAAVRSSAPLEDGDAASFAGVFETKLGVTTDTLEESLRECFASVFDPRAMQYGSGADWLERQQQQAGAFAAVVMEMVQEVEKAGVAFSANPLNSDLDEMLVDSSWGLGTSVVDGSIVADRFLWDKIGGSVLDTKIGSKEQERRLRKDGGGGVEVVPVSEERRRRATLTQQELSEIAQIVAKVEAAYDGKPVDVEWAYTQQGVLKLLQARPITTIFPLDPGMLTSPGEPRVLYFDFHIASDATTTHPFTHMDLDAYWDVWTKATGFQNIGKLPDDGGDHLFFNGQTRQYINVSATSRLGYSPTVMAQEYELIDKYAASILGGAEAQKTEYKAKQLPPDVTFRNAWWLMTRAPLWHMYKMKKKFQKNPAQCGEELKVLLAQARAEIKELVAQGPAAHGGLVPYVDNIARAAFLALDLQCAGAWLTLAVFKDLGKQLKEGETQQIRGEAADMMLGFSGDPLMEMNIAMYRLARELPADIWEEYDDKLSELAQRIQQNVEHASEEGGDLPASFVKRWKAFIDEHGYDGTDQLFVSSPRYHEDPVLLLEKLRHSVGPNTEDPEKAMLRARKRRQAAQERQLSAAESECWVPWFSRSVKNVKNRNLALDQIMWVRNSPKLFQSEILSAVRSGVLSCEFQLLESGRLDQAGDVFHLKMAEVDQALGDPALDLRQILAPRKAQYLRAKRATICPFLVDSRCRILKPDVKAQEEPGTLVGTAISPGVATGTVRLLASPREKLERGDILATVVTDPSWTPLFIGCEAVILQVGGALQHGALCAREYGKPGVSCIDMGDLKSGMQVSVDGNTGVVKIVDDSARGSIS